MYWIKKYLGVISIVRLLLKIKKCYPLLLPIIVIIFVQELCNPFSDLAILWALLLALFSFICSFCYRRYFLLSLLVLGVLSSHRTLPEFLSHEASAVLLQLQKAPKVHKVRDLSLNLMVLDAGSSSFLAVGDRVYCQTVSLVNNHASYLSRGKTFYVSALFQPLDRTVQSNFDRSLALEGYVAKCKINYLAPASGAKSSWIIDLKEQLIQMVQGHSFMDDLTALFLSMAIGYEQPLSLSQMEMFKGLGLAHLLVVSGFQVTLIFYSVRFLIQKFLLLSRRLSAILNIEILASSLAFMVSFFYAELVGFDSACLRAMIALSLLVVMKMLDRNVSFENIICSTFLVDLILHSYCYRQPGTQLTYFALLGIALGRSSKASFFINLIRINFYTTISTGIVSICWFGNFFLVSFFANLLITPIATILSCQMGFIALVLLYFDYRYFFDFCIYITAYLVKVSDALYQLFSDNISGTSILVLLILIFATAILYRIRQKLVLSENSSWR